jgi:transmembrane protein 222
MATHRCLIPYKHAESGASLSWDDALNASMGQFQHKFYNLFTCNCHSFVARCLNRLAYEGSVNWHVVNVGALILWKGTWADKMSAVRSFAPFVVVVFIGILMAGWPFLVGMAIFSAILLGWFIFGIYCVKGLIC